MNNLKFLNIKALLFIHLKKLYNYYYNPVFLTFLVNHLYLLFFDLINLVFIQINNIINFYLQKYRPLGKIIIYYTHIQITQIFHIIIFYGIFNLLQGSFLGLFLLAFSFSIYRYKKILILVIRLIKCFL